MRAISFGATGLAEGANAREVVIVDDDDVQLDALLVRRGDLLAAGRLTVSPDPTGCQDAAESYITISAEFHSVD